MQNITYKIRVNQLFTLPIRLLVNSKLSVRFWGNQSYTWTSDSSGAPNPHAAQGSNVLLNFSCEPFSSSLDFPTRDTSPVHGGGGGSIIPEVLERVHRKGPGFPWPAGKAVYSIGHPSPHRCSKANGPENGKPPRAT